jgi:hypothetical protein
MSEVTLYVLSHLALSFIAIAFHNSLNSNFLRIIVHLVMYDSGQVSLEHLLLSWYLSQRVYRRRQPYSGIPRHPTVLDAVAAYRGTSLIRNSPLLLGPPYAPLNLDHDTAAGGTPALDSLLPYPVSFEREP